jgi:hypothetical protein
VKTLFESILDAPSPAFTCERLGQNASSKPLIVKFQSEMDKAKILKNVSKLRRMSDRWPNISIAPDRTKREQTAFKNLRAECKTRQDRGEHVIILSNCIVSDKRYKSSDKVTATYPATAATQSSSSSCNDAPLLVNLPSIKTSN